MPIISTSLSPQNHSTLTNLAELMHRQLAQDYVSVLNIWYDRQELYKCIPLFTSEVFEPTDLLKIPYQEITRVPMTLKTKAVRIDGKEKIFLYVNIDTHFIPLHEDQILTFEVQYHDINLVEFEPKYGASWNVDSTFEIYLDLNPRYLLWSLTNTVGTRYTQSRAAVWDVANSLRAGRGQMPLYTTFSNQEVHLMAVEPREAWEQSGQVMEEADRRQHLTQKVKAPEHVRKMMSYHENKGETYRDLYRYYDDVDGNHRNNLYDSHDSDYDFDKLQRKWEGKIGRESSSESAGKTPADDTVSVSDKQGLKDEIDSSMVRRPRSSSLPPDTVRRTTESAGESKESSLATVRKHLAKLKLEENVKPSVVSEEMNRGSYAATTRGRYSQFAESGGNRGGHWSRGRGQPPRGGRPKPYDSREHSGPWEEKPGPKGVIKPKQEPSYAGAASAKEEAAKAGLDWERLAENLDSTFLDYIIALGMKSDKRSVIGARFRTPGPGYVNINKLNADIGQMFQENPGEPITPPGFKATSFSNKFDAFFFRQVPDLQIGKANTCWKRVGKANAKLREVIRASTGGKEGSKYNSVEATRVCLDEAAALDSLIRGVGDGELGTRLTVHLQFQALSLKTLFEVYHAILNKVSLTDEQREAYQWAYAGLSNVETFEAVKRHQLNKFPHDPNVAVTPDTDSEESSTDDGSLVEIKSDSVKTKVRPLQSSEEPTAEEDELNSHFYSVLEGVNKELPDETVVEFSREDAQETKNILLQQYHEIARKPYHNKRELWVCEMKIGKIDQHLVALDKKKKAETANGKGVKGKGKPGAGKADSGGADADQGMETEDSEAHGNDLPNLLNDVALVKDEDMDA